MRKRLLCLTLSTVLLFAAVACSKNSEDSFKSENIGENVTDSNDESQPIKMVDMSKEQTYSFRNFCVELFKNGYEEKDNYMVSPLSVLTALAMTSNGANGDTLTQMENTLFNGESISEINDIMTAYLNKLNSQDNVKINIADSIWIKNDESLTVKDSFLLNNKLYYNADVFTSDFDESTIDDVNSWISLKTDGMIKNMLEEIDKHTIMYLINAICFDAEWEENYNEYQIETHEFYNYDGSINDNVNLMFSEESKYIEDSQATGFIKDYKGGEFGFVVLLPNEGVDIYDYAASLTAEGFYEMVMNPQESKVFAAMPEFSSEYAISLKDKLAGMGIADAFDGDIADFSNLGEYSNSNIFIGDVFHKTFLNVDAKGTQAGAATIVQLEEATGIMDNYKDVRADRPFIYAIIDNATGMPLFMGMEVNIE